MPETRADIKADISAVIGSHESVALMEPMLLAEGSPQRGDLIDLAVEVAAASAGLGRSLPDGVRTALGDLVRAMNCYYSNLIEGHDTHPIDIERALNNDYSSDARKRNLQIEAKAHITVQRWIDAGGLKDRSVSVAGIEEIHHRFCALLPDDLLWIENTESGERLRVAPGRLRDRAVRVGQHIPISAGAVPRFLAHFENIYGRLGKTEAILSAAAAHHRLLWIHPFLDGNGRVARLVSHATLLDILDTGGIWSIARALGRNVVAYKSHLANCDQPRRNDLDGRGNLSEEALVAFTRFFLEVCIDQVRFMEGLVQPERLRTRIRVWAEEEIRLGHLPPKSGNILEAVLYRGELPRGEIAVIVGTGERQARRIISALVNKSVLHSESSRAPLRLAFPAALASRWMPGLFPEKIE
jgi:Fic family protein